MIEENSKVGLYVRVDKDIAEKLRKLTQGQYGLLSYHVNKALREYLEKLEQEVKTEKEEKKDTSTKGTISKFANPKLNTIIEELQEYEEIPDYELKEIIMKYAGSDERTIKKYLGTLEELGILEVIGRGKNIIIYRVKKDSSAKQEKAQKGVINRVEKSELKPDQNRGLTEEELRNHLDKLSKAEPIREITIQEIFDIMRKIESKDTMRKVI